MAKVAIGSASLELVHNKSYGTTPAMVHDVIFVESHVTVSVIFGEQETLLTILYFNPMISDL